MLTGRRYRLALTGQQLAYAEQVGAACRAVWNTGLEQRREYRRRGAWINYREQAGQMVEAKAEHAWLTSVPGHCLQQTLMDLDKACRRHGTWKVRWRSGRRWSPSFRFPEGGKMVVERLNRRWGRVKLPKLGWVRFRMTRALSGQVRSATVSREGNHWHVSFLVADGVTTPERHVGTSAVGLDRGVVAAVATSDGEMFDRACATAGEVRRYRRLQQRLARQRKGSANRRKTVAVMRAVRARERARRKDFCDQTAADLATEHAVIVLEGLKTRSMTASAKGSVDAPGRRVRQKAGLNRAILGKGWHLFEEALGNAARYTGSRIVKVPAAYTSQTCYRCEHVDPESRESQAVFRCTACGHTDNADVIAAKNILAAGRAVTACGDLTG
ncbi:transposase [Nocardia otitidiscaviarum]|nr:transposase [Nocardia otitidiscaviarum]